MYAGEACAIGHVVVRRCGGPCAKLEGWGKWQLLGSKSGFATQVLIFFLIAMIKISTTSVYLHNLHIR